MAVEHEVIIERPSGTYEGMRVSWGGVWAGVLVVLGTLFLLTTLGMAIGFSADARNVDPQKIGNGAVIWARDKGLRQDGSPRRFSRHSRAARGTISRPGSVVVPSVALVASSAFACRRLGRLTVFVGLWQHSRTRRRMSWH
jgi:hypothetical protein